MLRCRTSVTWTTKRLRTTEMTTASASAWTISRIARQDEGACSRGSSYSGRMTVWGVANSSSVYGRSVSTPEQARSGQCENLGDEPCGRAAHRPGLCPADPDRRMGALHGFRRADGRVHAVMLAVVRRAILRPEATRDLERVLELVHARRRARVVVAVGAVLRLLPAGAEAELETPTGDLIHAGGDLREQSGIPVLDRGDERAQSDAGGIAP